MKYILNQLASYFNEHKKRYVIVVLFMLIASAMYVAPTYIIRLFVDAIIAKQLTSQMLLQYSVLFGGAIVLAYLTEFVVGI